MILNAVKYRRYNNVSMEERVSIISRRQCVINVVVFMNYKESSVGIITSFGTKYFPVVAQL